MTGKADEGATEEGAMEEGAMEEEDAVRVVNAGTDVVAGVEGVVVIALIVAIVADVVNEGGAMVLEEAEVEEVVEARDWIQATPVPSHHFRVASL